MIQNVNVTPWNGNCDSLSGAGNLLRPTCHRLSSSATRCDVRNYYTGLHINTRPLARGELDSLRATRSALPACPAGYYIIRPLLQCFLTINNEFYYIYSNLWTAMVSWPRVLWFSWMCRDWLKQWPCKATCVLIGLYPARSLGHVYVWSMN